jgi:hypothetical protein
MMCSGVVFDTEHATATFRVCLTGWEEASSIVAQVQHKALRALFKGSMFGGGSRKGLRLWMWKEGVPKDKIETDDGCDLKIK